jgi:hypothetical protein
VFLTRFSIIFTYFSPFYLFFTLSTLPLPFQMSYYYGDTSYSDHGEPGYYYTADTPSYDANTPSYDDYTPSNDDYTPSYEEIHPAYYDHLVASNYDDNLLPQPSSYKIIDADELELYAEAAANRVYSYDDVDPSYLDNPTDSYTDSPNTVELLEDKTHPTYHDSSYSGSNTWTEYTWIARDLGNGIAKYNPPTDPTFYIPSSHDNAPDWDLVQSIELIAPVLEDYREYLTRVPDDLELIEETNQLTLVLQHMGEILAQRRTEHGVEDESGKVCEDDNGNVPTPNSSLPCHNIETTTLPLDTLTPVPLPLSPNIQYRPTQLTSAFLIAVAKHRERRYYFGSPPRRRRWNKIRTPPPYRRLPRPHPISPNIHTRSYHHSHPYRTPPDISTPQPLPLVPNILAKCPAYRQPRCPPHIRPQRKHPPVPPSPHQNVDRRHNAIRRISKRCSRMNIT